MADALDTYNKIEMLEEEEDVYTKDGTLDYKNNPANKNTTGTWKLDYCNLFRHICFWNDTIDDLSISFGSKANMCLERGLSCDNYSSGALYLVALGTRGIKPCVSSYGADQFDDADENEKKYAYYMKNKIKDPSVVSRLNYKDLKKMETAVDESIDWLDANHHDAEVTELLEKKKTLESLCNPFIAQLY